jgi:hypothetical protein
VTRFTALLAVLAVVFVNIEAADLHVHASSGDAHPQHQHGIAAHHHAVRGHARTNVPELQAPDPGDHVVRMVLCSILPSHVGYALAPVLRTTQVELASLPHRQMPRDTRAHSPPHGTIRLLRAPPADIPA